MKTYYIFTLTDPRNNEIYYVGKCLYPINRKSNIIHGYDTSFARYRSRAIIYNDLEPDFQIIDEINTPYNEYAVKLAACWRSKLIKDGWRLSNVRKTGFIYKEIKHPDKEMILLKKLAKTHPSEYDNARVSIYTESLDFPY